MPDRIVQLLRAGRRQQADSEESYLRVLVVQRGQDAEALEHIFKEGGYVPSIQQVPDARGLQDVLQRAPWHLLVADADDVDAGQVLRVVQRMQPDLAVILVAEQVGQEEIIQGLRAGAYDVIMRDRLMSVLAIVQRMHLLEQERRAYDHIQDALTLHGRAVEAAGIGLIIADMRQPGMPIVYGNPAFEEMTGFAPEEYLGRNCCSLPGSDTETTAQDDVRQAISSGQSCRVTLQKYRPDGTPFWSDLVLSPLRDRRGVVTHAVGLQSETRYRAIVEDQAEYVCRFRPNGQLTFANQAYARMIGRAPEDLVGANFLDWLPPEDQERCRRHLASFSPEDPVRTIEHQVRVPDGTTRWQHWTDRALFDADGALVEFQSTGRDVTERKVAEQEQEQLIEELDAFAHTVAHDLKSPLMTLIGFAEILEEEYDALTPEQLREFAGFIGRYAHKMNNIIDELMLLSKVRRAEAKVEPLTMETVVADALQRLGYLIEEYEPMLTMPDAWPMALGYAPWVAEVWVNYISNAIKYGGRPPRILLGADVQDDGMVRFWIRDNGDGLSPEAQERLFRPFERLEQVKGGGQGLGLSIVRRIVERLGGAVGVTSPVLDGRGSEFSFTLPAVGTSGDTGPWRQAPSQPLPSTA